MSIIIPEDAPYTHVTAFTHQGDIHLNNININSKLKVKTNGGIVHGDLTINSDSKLSITSEWSEMFVH